jgi:hypothetical protein
MRCCRPWTSSTPGVNSNSAEYTISNAGELPGTIARYFKAELIEQPPAPWVTVKVAWIVLERMKQQTLSPSPKVWTLLSRWRKGHVVLCEEVLCQSENLLRVTGKLFAPLRCAVQVHLLRDTRLLIGVCVKSDDTKDVVSGCSSSTPNL